MACAECRSKLVGPERNGLLRCFKCAMYTNSDDHGFFLRLTIVSESHSAVLNTSPDSTIDVTMFNEVCFEILQKSKEQLVGLQQNAGDLRSLVNGQLLNKRFSFTISKKGNPVRDGQPSVSYTVDNFGPDSELH